MSDIRHVMDKVPATGVPTAVAEGVYMLRLPLPFALDHVNVWLLEGARGWVIVDTGLGNKDCMAIWDHLLTSFLASKPIDKIILTHYHPDHVGLSGDLAARCGADVFMSRTEWLTANMLYYDREVTLGDDMMALFKLHGLPDDVLLQVQPFKSAYRDRCSTLPGGYFRLQHNDVIQMADSSWQCREGRGHSPEHISLYSADKKILIAGDHILPKITPNISMPVQDLSANPVADYLESIQNFKDIEDDVLILPSHRLPFKGLKCRIEQLDAHHQQRLATLHHACKKPITVYDALPVLFKRQLDANQMTFAMLEALAHMVYLEKAGKLVQQRVANKWYFSRV